MTSDVSPPGPPRRRTIEWTDPMVTAAGMEGRSGLEFMRALADGEIPRPPISLLLGFVVTRVEEGLVEFQCEPDESAYNPIGAVHGGLVCTLADSAAGCAVHTTLPAGVGYTSIDITVNYTRPVTSTSGVLVATGRVTKPGRRVALASVDVEDGQGRTVATATSNCLILPQAG